MADPYKLKERTFIKTHDLIKYTSEEGERIEFRTGDLFHRFCSGSECAGKGALFRVYGNNHEYLRGEEIYNALTNEFALNQLREAARSRVDSETFRQTIDDILASAFSKEVL